MTLIEVELRTIGARHLWDGRAAGQFIPGIVHFQAGVQMLAAAGAAGDTRAAAMLDEIRAELSIAERAVRRWRRGVKAFAEEATDGVGVSQREWLVEKRAVRVWRSEARRVAQVIVLYDEVCALTSVVTERARERHVFNPHHDSIRERAGRIRHVVDLGYRGSLYSRQRLLRENGRRKT